MRDKGPEIEIIRLLKAGPGFTSGQRLSCALGVSRTAIWKHMEALRKSGYRIEASPSKGYRLRGTGPFNGVEVSATLKTEFMGSEIHFFEETGSTNVKAFELARAGAPEGTVVMAESQSTGKGRIGRRWESPAGVNIYLSVILRPPVAPQNAPGLTFLAAVATAEAIAAFCPMRPIVKWPNDVLIEGGKAAGILLEMDAEPDRVHFVIVGIGINVNATREMFPEYIRNTATSLREKAGREIDRTALAARLLTGMETWYKVYLSRGFSPVLDEWKAYFGFKGSVVKVTSFDNIIKGRCLGVDDAGALILEKDSGEVVKVLSGDVEAV